MKQFTISQIDPRTETISVLQAMHVFDNHLRAERLPEDPPHTFEEYVAAWQHLPPNIEIAVFIVWHPLDNSAVIAIAKAAAEIAQENQHIGQFDIQVLPEFRRQGLGRWLLCNHILPFAHQHQRQLLITDTSSHVAAGEPFMVQFGAAHVLHLQTYQLDLHTFDPSLLTAWSQNGHTAAFELDYWDGPYPQDHLPEIGRLIEVMNQQPRGELAVEDVTLTPERLQEMDQHQLADGTERWMLYARHKEDGRLAGFTDVLWHPNRPALLKQDLTGVLPEYRGHGLGRLLKAVMLRRVLKERPQVRYVRTTNANANAPMLKINRALGFQPFAAHTIWQLKTDELFS